MKHHETLEHSPFNVTILALDVEGSAFGAATSAFGAATSALGVVISAFALSLR